MQPSQLDFEIEPVAESRAPVTIIKNYLSIKQQGELFKESDSFDWQQPEINIFGKFHPIPRSQIWFADKGCDYYYSNLLIKAQSWPYFVNQLRFQLNEHFNMKLNGVLVNRYKNGTEHMGWHSDDEPEIMPCSDILSISFGAERDFVIQHKTTRKKQVFTLESGDLLIMHSPMQQQWKHCLPKRLKIKEARINLTFRQLIPNFHC